MKGFFTLAWIEFKLFMREPAAVFFTLAFPMMLLFVFGAIFGNDPAEGFDGRGSVDISVPGYTGLIIGTTTFMTIPIVISEYRSQGIFRRLRATPISPLAIIGAHTLIYLVVTLLGLLLLFVAGKLVYDLVTPANIPMLLLVIVVSFLSLAAMGYLIGSVFKTPRTAQVVGNIVYFPQIFLAGAGLPREIMSETLQAWTEWLPMTQMIEMFKAVWWGESMNVWSLMYLIGIGLVAAIISVKVFRWE